MVGYKRAHLTMGYHLTGSDLTTLRLISWFAGGPRNLRNLEGGSTVAKRVSKTQRVLWRTYTCLSKNFGR